MFYREGSSLAGNIATIEAITVYIQVIGGYSFAAYAQRFVITDERSAIAIVWRWSATASLVLGATSFIGLYVLRPGNLFLWDCAILTAVLQSCAPSWVMRGNDRMGAYAEISLVAFGLSAIFVLGGIYLHHVYMYFLGYLPGFAYGLGRYAKLGFSLKPAWNWRMIPEVTAFMSAQVSIQIYTSVDVILVAAFLGWPSAGVYALLYKANYLLMAAYAILQQNALLSRRALSSYSFLLGLAAFALIWLLLSRLHSALPSPFRTDWVVVAILGGQFAIAVAGLGWVLTALTGPPMIYAALTIGGAMANVVGNVVLIPIFGLRGSALATGLSEALVVLLAIVLAPQPKAISGAVRVWPSLLAVGLVVAGSAAMAAVVPA